MSIDALTYLHSIQNKAANGGCMRICMCVWVWEIVWHMWVHLLWFVTVLLGYGAVNWIYMAEYEVHFHIVSTLVRSKHDGVGRFVIELKQKQKPKERKPINKHGNQSQFIFQLGLRHTVVRSSVSLPDDSNFRYEPPHSWPSCGKRNWNWSISLYFVAINWISQSIGTGVWCNLRSVCNGQLVGWLLSLVIDPPALWPHIAPPAVCSIWSRTVCWDAPKWLRAWPLTWAPGPYLWAKQCAAVTPSSRCHHIWLFPRQYRPFWLVISPTVCERPQHYRNDQQNETFWAQSQDSHRQAPRQGCWWAPPEEIRYIDKEMLWT